MLIKIDLLTYATNNHALSQILVPLILILR